MLKHCEDPSAQVEIENLISKYSGIFSTVPSTTNVLTHTIKLDDTTPVRKMPYSAPLAYRDIFRAELDKMTQDNLTEPSNSDYASTCIIIPKKDKNEIRIVIDYRSLYSKLVKDRDPIKNVQSIFARIPKCKY